MIPANIKRLVEQYCMGLEPTEAQENEIMDAVKAAALNAESRREVVSYMAELMAGPTREQKAEAEAEAKRKAAEEARRRAAAKAEKERLRMEKESEEKRRQEEEESIRREKEAAEAERIRSLTAEQKFKEGKQFIKGKSYKKGIDLISMAANEGFIDAFSFLVFGLLYGKGGIKKESDQVKVHSMLVRYLTEHPCESHKDYARLMYERGKVALDNDLNDDPSRSFERAAEFGNVDALSFTAFGYEFGKYGFPKDEKKAVHYYLEFVAKGDNSHDDYKVALYNLGQIFYFGKYGEVTDKERGLSYYRQSAALGYGSAQKRLKQIEEMKEEEARKKRNTISRLVTLFIVTLIYGFLTIWTIIEEYPFWLLMVGVAYLVFYWLVEMRDAYKYGCFIPLIPISTVCIFFITYSDGVFWIWFWVIVLVVSLMITIRNYFVNK